MRRKFAKKDIATMKLIEEIALSNGLTLQIVDHSRVIAADTVKVDLSFQIRVDLLEGYFADREDFLAVQTVTGDVLTYEHKVERTFVSLSEETSARNNMIETFKNNSLRYVSHDQFARKLALSKLRDIRSNPYKYRARTESESHSTALDDSCR